jgi:DNA-binding NtrC family response regulator
MKTLAQIEREAIEDALRECGGNRTRAAMGLGVSIRTIQRKLLQYGINNTRKRGIFDASPQRRKRQ